MELNQKTREFIEKMGLMFEHAGSTRTHGRMMGLLLVADTPLSLDEMSERLQVSKASLSTNARLAVHIGMAQRVGRPGDRRDYYEMTPASFERMVAHRVLQIDSFVQLADEGLAAIGSGHATAQTRLEHMKEFYQFFLRELEESLERWRRRREEG